MSTAGPLAPTRRMNSPCSAAPYARPTGILSRQVRHPYLRDPPGVGHLAVRVPETLELVGPRSQADLHRPDPAGGAGGVHALPSGHDIVTVNQ